MKPLSDPWRTSLSGAPLTASYTVACGVMGGLVGSEHFLKVFPSLAGNPTLLGTTVAIYEIGAFFGSILCSAFSDRLGRRISVLTASLVVFVGAALQAASVNLAMLIVFRVFTGLGIGVLTSITPSFHAECVPAKIRGRIVSVQLILCAVGLTTSFWVDYGCSYVNGQFAWRFPVALQCLFPIITILLLLFLPDSPRWYVEQGRIDDARDVLIRLNGVKMGEAILQEIQEAASLEAKVASNSYFDVFKNNDQSFRYRTLLSIGSLFFQQMVRNYSAVIFQQSVGLSANLSLLLSGFNGLNSLFWITFTTFFLIDRVGRVRLMMWTAAIQVAIFAVLAGVLHDVTGSKANGIVGASMLFLFFATFSIGWLAPSWLYPAEITPLAIRGSAASLGSASNWIFNFLVVEITPTGIANIGSKYYIIYAYDGKVYMRRSPNEPIHVDSSPSNRSADDVKVDDGKV
ncbi:general substrate transporter [Sistotremastrum niveocremeum HHB9708]|uniref:General substrate transporter n=1 Tax=Sistotremastrum niveocremeum HHB9708 TaxID=1314777 RepID=A0A164RL11_9AGAM|nr:general substrate transporter [Sistotremastrum niveocremeum HHB9708]